MFNGGHFSSTDPYSQQGKPLTIEQLHLAGASEDPKKFYFEEDMLTIIKKCKEFEVDVYECIFNTDRLPPEEVDEDWRAFYHGLRSFVPRYYEAKLYDFERGRFNVRLQNLLNIHKEYTYDRVILKEEYSKDKARELMEEAKGMKRASYLDMKMGTNCVLR